MRYGAGRKAVVGCVLQGMLGLRLPTPFDHLLPWCDQPPLPCASCRSPDYGLRPLKPWAEQTFAPCKLLLRYFLTESWLSQASHPGKHWPRPRSATLLPSCVRIPLSMVPLGCLRNFHSLSNSGRFPRGTDNICSCCHCIYVQISMDYI